MAIKFNKFNVTNGTDKARVHYSFGRNLRTGTECVTLYAKDFQSGRALGAMLSEGYENDTDSRLIKSTRGGANAAPNERQDNDQDEIEI